MMYLLVVNLILTTIIIIKYFEQRRLNKFFMTYCFGDDASFKGIIENMYVNDAFKIKKYIGKTFKGWVDIDNDDRLKDIKKN